jgi:hypothetical protein
LNHSPEDKKMSRTAKTIRFAAISAVRAVALVALMTGPVLAVTMLKPSNGHAASGAGLVLYVSLERA